jgi:hypothetical protein
VCFRIGPGVAADCKHLKKRRPAVVVRMRAVTPWSTERECQA